MIAPPPVWQIPLNSKPSIRDVSIYRLEPKPVYRWRFLNFWAIHFYRQEAEFSVDGQSFQIRPRSVSITPPSVDLEYRLRVPLDYLYAHFVFPVESRGTAPIQVVTDLGKEFEPMFAAMQVALASCSAQPARADARLWDVLWQLAERRSQPADGAGPHPAVRKALQIIEGRLGESIEVAPLAAEIGISQNHLTRLFRASVGNTVLGYVRGRRMRRAEHLLAQTTLPIKAIAAEVNVPDLHQFNKLVRRELGHSPRDIRRIAASNPLAVKR